MIDISRESGVFLEEKEQIKRFKKEMIFYLKKRKNRQKEIIFYLKRKRKKRKKT